MAANFTHRGCGPNVDSLYYNLCDLTAVWGIVVEAFAAAGVIFSFVLFLTLLASLPFIQDKKRRSAVGLHACFLVCTAGLFCLTFAFIVGKDFSTCASRRFLFGVLFGGCFACLLMQCVRLNILARQNSGPQGWVLCLGAVGLWLVEVIINTEWLIITVVNSAAGAGQLQVQVNTTEEAVAEVTTPCTISNQDFVMALIYVMVLLLATMVASLSIMAGNYKPWKMEGSLIIITSLVSICVWLAWIVMYVYGNEKTGGPTWDDPTLAIALVANAWVFLCLYTIPQICCLTSNDEGQQTFGEDLYPSRGVGYETILKEQSSQNMFMENKAFSMDEPNQGAKPVSPYSGYTGQLRSSVYQPTELALITKAVANVDQSIETVIPRASTNSAANSGSSTLSQNHESGNATYVNVNGVGRTPKKLLLLLLCVVFPVQSLTSCCFSTLLHVAFRPKFFHKSPINLFSFFLSFCGICTI